MDKLSVSNALSGTVRNKLYVTGMDSFLVSNSLFKRVASNVKNAEKVDSNTKHDTITVVPKQ